jgi:hypothetical protein
VLEDCLKDVHSSSVYSLMLDESTDNANHKMLLLYLQYYTDNGLQQCLLDNVQLTEAKAGAETIVNRVLDELKQKGLDVSKMVGIGTDGASVMTGRHNGVVVRLREHSPALVGVHCAAHRCALASSQAAKQIPELADYSRTVTSIFRYFSNSALRANKLREIQHLMNLPQLKYADIHSVRWLSLQAAVEVLYRTYPALVATLQREATSNPAAKGLLQEVNQYRFIGFTHLLMDVLPFLGKLCKGFQSESLDFSKVKPLVDSTCESLKDMVECPCNYVDKLDVFVVEEQEKYMYSRPLSESEKGVVRKNVNENVDGFDGFDCESDSCVEEETGPVEVRYYVQQKGVVVKVMERYVNLVVENLESRFQESDVIEKMQVLVPGCVMEEHEKRDGFCGKVSFECD